MKSVTYRIGSYRHKPTYKDYHANRWIATADLNWEPQGIDAITIADRFSADSLEELAAKLTHIKERLESRSIKVYIVPYSNKGYSDEGMYPKIRDPAVEEMKRLIEGTTGRIC